MLQNLEKFRDTFIVERIQHKHRKLPCLICSLKDIFKWEGGEVNITSLRKVLCANFRDINFFRQEETNDVTKVLTAIFWYVHRESGDGACESQNTKCLAHKFFGTSVFEQAAAACLLESRDISYTRFFYRVDVISLLKVKTSVILGPCTQSRFHDHLKNDKYALQAPKDVFYMHNFVSCLSEISRYITIVLSWPDDMQEELVSDCFDALPSEIYMGAIFEFVKPMLVHILVAVLAYDGRNYKSYGYNDPSITWFEHKSLNIKEEKARTWPDFSAMLKLLKSRPLILVYEASS